MDGVPGVIFNIAGVGSSFVGVSTALSAAIVEIVVAAAAARVARAAAVGLMTAVLTVVVTVDLHFWVYGLVSVF